MMMMAIFIAHGSIDSMLNALKEIIDRKWTEKNIGKTEKFRCTVSLADTEKELSIRKQVSF